MKAPSLSLRSYTGKKLVSYLREGDYAHAGEIEAIHKVMNKFVKNKNRTILDAGCGLGGTANYIQKNGWGHVVGVDIENKSIKYAKRQYPSLKFYTSDILDIKKLFFSDKFDLICLFNSFYAFKKQKLSLECLFDTARINANLAIFDYSDPLIDATTSLYKEGDGSETPFKPIKLQCVSSMLTSTGWSLLEIVDMSKYFISWYTNLLERLERNKHFITAEFGYPAYLKANDTYLKIHNALVTNQLGGAIVYAQKA